MLQGGIEEHNPHSHANTFDTSNHYFSQMTHKPFVLKYFLNGQLPLAFKLKYFIIPP